MDGGSEETLREAVRRGQARWPEVALDAEALARHVRPQGIPEATLLDRAADLYLAAGCATGLEAANRAFERTYLSRIDTFVRRFGLSKEQLDEVRQRLRIRLLTGPQPVIRQYSGMAPLEGYLRVCATRTALEVLGRAGRPSLEATDRDLARQLDQRQDTEMFVIKRRYLPAFQAALEKSLQALSARDRTILRFHFVEGMSIDVLGTVYRVHRATAARWLVDIRKRVFESVCQQLSVDLRTTQSEFRSLLDAVASDLHVSLTRLLISSTAESV